MTIGSTGPRRMKPRLGRLEEVNKELWLLLSLFGICLLLNLVVDGQRMVLSFYTLPTLGSAYLYGRRHATLTALGSVLLVCLMTWYNPVLPDDAASSTGLYQVMRRTSRTLPKAVSVA